MRHWFALAAALLAATPAAAYDGLILNFKAGKVSAMHLGPAAE